MSSSASACNQCAIHRILTLRTATTPSSSANVCSAASTDAVHQSPDDQSNDRIGERDPSATPLAPTRTASEVNPSVRACSPSATSAAVAAIHKGDVTALRQLLTERPDLVSPRLP